jgi:TfoX/Sxy family transcriptional regulator of competence genes
MAYNEELAERTRLILTPSPIVLEEKKMMGGLAFMVNGKMCVGVMQDNLMVRISPDVYAVALKKPGCKPMDFTGRVLKGFVFVDGEGTDNQNDLQHWVDLALQYNPFAKASPKKR